MNRQKGFLRTFRRARAVRVSNVVSLTVRAISGSQVFSPTFPQYM